MPLESPEVVYDSFSPFQLIVSRQTEQGNLTATLEVRFNADGYTPETVLATFQELVDFVSTSPDFTLLQAQRIASGYQPITPTPAP
jgi:hypothetical protein